METFERARLDACFDRIASPFAPPERPADTIEDEALRGRVLQALR